MNRRQFTALALAALATPLSIGRAMAAFTDYQAENFVLLFGSSVTAAGRGAYEKVVVQQLH